jgi:natural resistance-associated macrophage protein
VFGASVFNYSYSDETQDIRTTCTEHISLLNAADCLYYRYNHREWVPYVWAIGLLAAGQSSTMTGTYAGQFVMEGFLNIHWARWKRVLLTRSVAMVPCVIIAILAVNSLDYLDEYINVEQSMLLPFSLIPLLHATSSRKIMGSFKNSLVWSIVVWVVAVIIVVVNVYFVIVSVAIPGKWWQHTVASVGIFIYLSIVMLFAFYPLLGWLWPKFQLIYRRKLLVTTHSSPGIQD